MRTWLRKGRCAPSLYTNRRREAVDCLLNARRTDPTFADASERQGRCAPSLTRPHARWRRRSAPASSSVRSCASRPSARALASAGRPVGRVGTRGLGLLPDHPPPTEKNQLPPPWKEYWAIPPAQSATLGAAREDVLPVYPRPRDPVRPMIGRDETSQQVLGETRIPLPVAPGQARREEDEYERRGVANLVSVR